MAAAGPNAQSISWAASATLGRMCGSIWALAVLPALLEEPTSRLTTEDVEKILPENANEEQRKAVSFLCRSVFEYPFKKVDRKAARTRFRDDEWGHVMDRPDRVSFSRLLQTLRSVRELPNYLPRTHRAESRCRDVGTS